MCRLSDLLMMGLYTSLIDSGWRKVVWLRLRDGGVMISAIEVDIG